MSKRKRTELTLSQKVDLIKKVMVDPSVLLPTSLMLEKLKFQMS